MAPAAKIKFGTDGWRGIIAEDYTFANVRRVAAAVADSIRAKRRSSRGVVVGYDARFQSDRFALAAAEVLAAHTIPVALADRPTPTPALSYAVIARRAAGAIVITASHNPYYWNGFKLKAPEGCSVSLRLTRDIERRIPRKWPPDSPPRRRKPAPIETVDLVTPYLKDLETFIDFDKVRASGLRFVADAMHGAGRHCLGRLFERHGIPHREIRSDLNPLFPGINPEPIDPHVEALRQAVVKSGYDAGFALDGDGDRIGAMDRRGGFVDSHKVFSLLFRHLYEGRGLQGEVVKGFASTTLIDKLAAKYGLRLHVTAIGFKYISDIILERDVLIGGEESGGITVKGRPPERDGVLCSLLLAEMMAHHGKGLEELIAEFDREFGEHHYQRVDLHIGLDKARKVASLVQNGKVNQVAGLKVTGTDTLDGVKLWFGPSTWLLVRPSGTEDLLRLYAEAPSKEQLGSILDEMKKFARKYA